MRSNAVSVLFALAIVWVLPAPAAAQVRVSLPDSVRSGDIVQVTVHGDAPIERVQVRVSEPDGESSDYHAFAVSERNDVWVSLFGLGSSNVTGLFSVDVLVVAAEETRIVNETIRVAPRAYLSERIVLNRAMTTLLTIDVERRRREALEMDSVVRTVNHTSVFHLGRLQNPVVGGRETSFFGDRRTFDYADGNRGYTIHQGWDLAAPVGTPVRAGGSGVVVMVADRLVAGRTVVIEHLPGVFTLYYHLDTVRVSPGDPVLQGRIIGTVGVTGLATGPHLHWELRVGGEAVDPARYIDRPLVDMSAVVGTMAEVLQERG